MLGGLSGLLTHSSPGWTPCTATLVRTPVLHGLLLVWMDLVMLSGLLTRSNPGWTPCTATLVRTPILHGLLLVWTDLVMLCKHYIIDFQLYISVRTRSR